MPRLAFGSDQSLKCIGDISPFTITAAEGKRSVCFAASIKNDFFIVPWRVYVDDYVLKVEDESSTYYTIDRDLIQYHQSQGNLPDTLPRYTLSFPELLWGHSLWILLLLVAANTLRELIQGNSKDKSVQSDD